MTTEPEIYTLRNGSTIEVRCIYPEKNDPLIMQAIARGMAHIGLFDGIFDDDKSEEKSSKNVPKKQSLKS